MILGKKGTRPGVPERRKGKGWGSCFTGHFQYCTVYVQSLPQKIAFQYCQTIINFNKARVLSTAHKHKQTKTKKLIIN